MNKRQRKKEDKKLHIMGTRILAYILTNDKHYVSHYSESEVREFLENAARQSESKNKNPLTK